MKSQICDAILHALPEWFGVEASIVDYINKVRELTFYAAFDSCVPAGFAALKTHNAYTAEVCVIGVQGVYHRMGIGKKLIALCEGYCGENNLEYLTVKTLDGSSESEGYEKTRMFYFSVGFRPLEVFPVYWDENNPCLFMVKKISAGVDFDEK